MKHLVLLGLLVLSQSVHMRQLPFLTKQGDSCVGRCGDGPNDGTFSCYCNTFCVDNGDCCSDYDTVCQSCQDRCFESYDPNAPCACNSECPDHGNCCPDHDEICGGTGGGVTDQDLVDLSELLFTLEVTNAGQYITWDAQGPNNGGDGADGPLFTSFDSAAIWALETPGLLYAMFDNYEAEETSPDTPTQAEVDEQNAFLDAIISKPVMNEAYNFLNTHGYIGDTTQWRSKLFEMWFDPYNRDATDSSSGFEHVGIGELDVNGNKVGGFHGWYHYAFEELESGTINYKGYNSANEVVDFGRPGYGGATISFTWQGYNKAIGGFFIGTSPELDLAVKTVCWIIRAGSTCRMAYNGVPFEIVSYNNDGQHVATAYPVFNP